jgi:hypothetical protein
MARLETRRKAAPYGGAIGPVFCTPYQWHNLCSLARRHSGRTCIGCFPECCRTSVCSRTPGCRTLSRRLGGRRSTDMHLKRYQRQTVQEALRAVRADLGPDALVLSTRLVTTAGSRGWPGKRLVEVTAAADRPAMTVDRQEAADAGREASTPAEVSTCA